LAHNLHSEADIAGAISASLVLQPILGEQAMQMEQQKGHYRISADKTKLDLAVIHDFLTNSYWARGIPLETVRRAVEHSLCFGVYDGEQQVGFARLVTDYATFAYLADVFIIESHRGRGLSKWLMGVILSYPELQKLRRWLLMTRDAHGLYRQVGFHPLPVPEWVMEIHDHDVYLRS
jgi:GNAT superfamily N-acetyltransferase